MTADERITWPEIGDLIEAFSAAMLLEVDSDAVLMVPELSMVPRSCRPRASPALTMSPSLTFHSTILPAISVLMVTRLAEIRASSVVTKWSPSYQYHPTMEARTR